jgi:hypothetical protein
MASLISPVLLVRQEKPYFILDSSISSTLFLTMQCISLYLTFYLVQLKPERGPSSPTGNGESYKASKNVVVELSVAI